MNRLIEMTEHKVTFLQERCAQNARHLGEDLIRLADNIHLRRPSELGEIQSRGTILDCCLARLATYMDILEELTSIKEDK